MGQHSVRQPRRDVATLQQPDGAILALDPPGTQVWLVHGGWEADDQVDLRGPVVAPFVVLLVALGIFEPRWPGA